jgi:ABC-type branched-subunit amino acid transport system substrate-binding protein
MKHASGASRRTAVTVLTLVAMSVATLCAAGGVAHAKSATKTAKCPGTPLKFTAIISKTGSLAGPGGVLGTDVEDGINAAVKGVNDQCSAGVPIQFKLCDDQGDPNVSNACGRAAKSDGSLAIAISAGSRDGAGASGLPLILSGGLGGYEITSPNSYPADSPITEIFGSISASSAAKVKTYLMLATDDPAIHALSGTLTDLAKAQGVKLDFLYFPADTTDFAPIAAQAAGQHPDAIGLAVGTITPVINALKIEGITPQNTPMFTAVALVTPQIKRELGSKVDGINLISTVVPAQDTSNPGIRQMLAELKAAGVKTKPADIGTQTAETWAHVHMLADVIGKLPSADRAALTPDSLVKALVAASPLTSANEVVAPIDYTANAFPSVPALAPLRLFGNQVITVRVVKGKYVPITAFQNATEPFKLLKKSSRK